MTKYGQYCPISMTAEVLCTRWTMLVIRELLNGNSRFNELRRGLGRMSPALLSQRLKELEDAGVVRRVALRGHADLFEYRLTDAGQALASVIEPFAVWGQTWMEKQATLDNASIDHLMWELQQHAKPGKAPKLPSAIKFQFAEQPKSKRSWWLLFDGPNRFEVCHDDPGREIDAYVTTDVATLIAIWLGFLSPKQAIANDAMVLTGDRAWVATMPDWLGLSPVAGVPKRGGIQPGAR